MASWQKTRKVPVSLLKKDSLREQLDMLPVHLGLMMKNAYFLFNIPRDNTRDILLQLRAVSEIRSAATKKMVSRILAIVSRDLVVAEGHNHRCYRLYTKEEVPLEMISSYEDDAAAAQYEAALNKSYNPQMMTMTDLSSRLVASMNSQGIVQVKKSTKKHIRRNLEGEFGGALHIFPDEKGKLLLYPDCPDLSMRELAIENPEVKPEAECPTFTESFIFILYSTHRP